MKYALVNRFPALASRDFVLFLVGQFISVIGTWMQTTAFNLGRVLGPALAAPLLVLGGEGTVFLANGISFVFVIAGLLLARTSYQIPREALGEKSMRTDSAKG